VTEGGVAIVTYNDKKVPFNKIQLIEITAGEMKYLYKRI